MNLLLKNLFRRMPERSKCVSKADMLIIESKANQAARNAECSHLNRLEDMRIDMKRREWEHEELNRKLEHDALMATLPEHLRYEYFSMPPPGVLRFVYIDENGKEL